MIFYKRNTFKEKHEWHIWFAWKPVKVFTTKDYDSKYAWLHYVYRCGKYHHCMWNPHWEWRYKEKL